MEWAATILQAVIGGLITGGAAYAAIKVELRWLRRDIDETRDGLKSVHSRIDALFNRGN